VVAAFYPLEWMARGIGGDHIEVGGLTSPGVEPHDLELTPGQVRQLSEAELVIYLGEGFQPAVEEVMADLGEGRGLDLLAKQELLTGQDEHAEDEHAEDEAPLDPHVWLDPVRMADMASTVADHLSDLAPEHREDFKANARALRRALMALHNDYQEALADCARDELVVSHEAFGYLVERYGLEQVGISGLDPESEPSPGRLAEVAELARERGVTTIFFERFVQPDVAQTLADEIGIETAVLDPLEFPPEGDADYLDVMRTNLESIGAALDCA
jgi:zinc transport system substrate-binding protein